MADNDFQRPAVDLCFVFAVEGMKMRRCMLPPEHLNHDSEELADGWHGFVVWGQSLIMPLIFWPRRGTELSGLRQGVYYVTLWY